MLGEPVNLMFKPAPADHGIAFHRIDLPDQPIVQVCPENYEEIIPRCTSLRAGEAAVNSVEHLLSALGGMGIDNLKVDIDAPECPALDGSALPYVQILQQAEIVETKYPARPH